MSMRLILATGVSSICRFTEPRVLCAVCTENSIIDDITGTSSLSADDRAIKQKTSGEVLNQDQPARPRLIVGVKSGQPNRFAIQVPQYTEGLTIIGAPCCICYYHQVAKPVISLVCGTPRRLMTSNQLRPGDRIYIHFAQYTSFHTRGPTGSCPEFSVSAQLIRRCADHNTMNLGRQYYYVRQKSCRRRAQPRCGTEAGSLVPVAPKI